MGLEVLLVLVAEQAGEKLFGIVGTDRSVLIGVEKITCLVTQELTIEIINFESIGSWPFFIGRKFALLR